MKNLTDEKKCVILLALTIIMGFLLFYTYSTDMQNEHPGLVRLHVIANSNTAGDQALKLKVRDAIIEYMSEQEDLKTVDETREYLKANTGRLEKIAEGVIAAEGCDYKAKANLGVRYIPEKTYGDITFPAGNYEALNITIGSGKGENWWCVLFPPLCILDEGSETTGGGSGGGSAYGAADESGNAAYDSSGDSSVYSAGEPAEYRLRLRWKLIDLLND